MIFPYQIRYNRKQFRRIRMKIHYNNTFYSQIHEYTPLTQEEIVQLYQSEQIDGLSYQQQLNAIKRKKDELYDETYLACLLDSENIPENKKDLITQLEEKEQKLKKQMKDEFAKLQISTQKKKCRERNYPSKELQAKIFLGTIHILKYPVWKKYVEMKYTEEYDDIYQVAAMALLSAIHYYVPSGEAAFKTYATKCIQNQLNMTFYLGSKKKKRKRAKPLTLEKELEHMRLLKDFLDAHVVSKNRNVSLDLSIGRLLFHKRFLMDPIPTKLKLRRFNQKIIEFNQELLSFGKSLYPRVSRKKDLEEDEATYQKIMNTFSHYLRMGMLNELISDEDRELINLLTIAYHVKEQDKNFFILRQYVCLYIYKLNRIKYYLELEKDLTISNDGILPSTNDILKRINRDVKEFNKKYYRYHHPRLPVYLDEIEYKKPLSFYEAYYQQYGIDFLSQYDCSREEEKEMLVEDYEALVDQLEELIDQLESEEDDEKFTLHLSDSDNYYDIGEDEKAVSKLEALKTVKNFLKQVGTEEEYIAHVLKERTKIEKKMMDEHNAKVYQYNQQISKNLPAHQASSYQKPWKENDLLEIEKDIALIYTSEEALTILSNQERKLSKRTVLSTEEQAIIDDFLTTYYQALDTLPTLEKEILLRWFDEEGKHQCTAQEIGKELGIPPRKVYQLKEKGLHHLASNPNISAYKDA